MNLVAKATIGLVVVALAGCGDDGDGGATASGSASASATVTDSAGTDSNTATATATNTVSDTANTDSQGSDGSTGDTNPSTSGTDSSQTTSTATESTTSSATGTGSVGTDTGSTGGTDSTSGTGSSGSDDSSGSSTGNAATDTDDDGIPDDDDPFPDDDTLPGVVVPNTVYAHTSSTLFTMGVTDPYTVTQIGGFTFPMGSNGSVTDIAIDRWGVLYAITFNDLFACNPADAACYHLADIPNSSNGLTFIPPGTLDLADDALIGIGNNGDWRHMELMGGVVNQVVLGNYGGGYTSSGDAFSIEGVGTFASVDAAGQTSDVIVEVDPTDGTVLLEVGAVTGYTTVYGLAGWQGSIFAFDSSGDVLLVDPDDGTFEVINDTNNTWYGAAVSTVLPQ